MTVREFAVEAMLYRTAGLIDGALLGGATGAGARRARRVRHRGVDPEGRRERDADYVLDENVQIHGGNGFVRDYPAELTIAMRG